MIFLQFIIKSDTYIFKPIFVKKYFYFLLWFFFFFNFIWHVIGIFLNDGQTYLVFLTSWHWSKDIQTDSFLIMMEISVLSERVDRLVSRNAGLQAWKSFSLHLLQITYHLLSAWNSPAMYCIFFYFKFNCQQESCLIWLFVLLVFISQVGTQTFKKAIHRQYEFY